MPTPSGLRARRLHFHQPPVDCRVVLRVSPPAHPGHVWAAAAKYRAPFFSQQHPGFKSRVFAASCASIADVVHSAVAEV